MIFFNGGKIMQEKLRELVDVATKEAEVIKSEADYLNIKSKYST